MKNLLQFILTALGCQWFSHVWIGEEIMSIGKIGWEAKEKKTIVYQFQCEK